MKNSFKGFDFLSMKFFYNDFPIFRFFRKIVFFKPNFLHEKKYFFCSDFFSWKAMGISFPTHLARASKDRHSFEKKQLISGFFLEASSYV